MTLREEVKDFADKMESILKENYFKGEWTTCSKEYLITKLFEEFGELINALMKDNNEISITQESVDVANVLMMLEDKFGDKLEGSFEMNYAQGCGI
jgi:NTP pyrophosphatase (non-canonical NTP hydrolase)